MAIQTSQRSTPSRTSRDQFRPDALAQMIYEEWCEALGEYLEAYPDHETLFPKIISYFIKNPEPNTPAKKSIKKEIIDQFVEQSDLLFFEESFFELITSSDEFANRYDAIANGIIEGVIELPEFTYYKLAFEETLRTIEARHRNFDTDGIRLLFKLNLFPFADILFKEHEAFHFTNLTKKLDLVKSGHILDDVIEPGEEEILEDLLKSLIEKLDDCRREAAQDSLMKLLDVYQIEVPELVKTRIELRILNAELEQAQKDAENNPEQVLPNIHISESPQIDERVAKRLARINELARIEAEKATQKEARRKAGEIMAQARLERRLAREQEVEPDPKEEVLTEPISTITENREESNFAIVHGMLTRTQVTMANTQVLDNLIAPNVFSYVDHIIPPFGKSPISNGKLDEANWIQVMPYDRWTVIGKDVLNGDTETDPNFPISFPHVQAVISARCVDTYVECIQLISVLEFLLDPSNLYLEDDLSDKFKTLETIVCGVEAKLRATSSMLHTLETEQPNWSEYDKAWQRIVDDKFFQAAEKTRLENTPQNIKEIFIRRFHMVSKVGIAIMDGKFKPASITGNYEERDDKDARDVLDETLREINLVALTPQEYAAYIQGRHLSETYGVGNYGIALNPATPKFTFDPYDSNAILLGNGKSCSWRNAMSDVWRDYNKNKISAQDLDSMSIYYSKREATRAADFVVRHLFEQI